MTYQQCLDWLYSQLPMYQRIGPGANYKIDLDKTHQLMDLLGHPENTFKSIHVAGTNGKGSVSHMLAAIFQKAGYKTGLYTSPHLKDFRERIRIDGSMVAEEEVLEFVEARQQDFEKLEMSFFEMTVGMAFDAFRRHQVDIAIVEVGMGGRLDSTNVIRPELSIITNISLDHTQFLGNSIPEIAREKAGIIKSEVPVVIGERQDETTPVYEEIAHKLKAPLLYAEQLVHYRDIDLRSDLPGIYQRQNIRTVLCAVQQLEKQGWQLQATLAAALANVKGLTALRGRWEILNKNPLTITDTGHNEAGVRAVLDQLQKLSYRQLHMVWGMVGDKDATAILRMLPKGAFYYFCKPDIPRGRDAEDLKRQAVQFGLSGKSYSSVQKALAAARAHTLADDVIFIGGSIFVVAEVLP